MNLQAEKIALIKLLIETEEVSLIQKIKDLFKKENKEIDYDLTKSQKIELDKRLKKHLSGESKSYSWEETKQEIIDKHGLQA
ncbi:MAG: addiction module protein [Bacteroidetes bacterium]|nr:MAG: addiction module protein [Bacteroidota bacterium]